MNLKGEFKVASYIDQGLYYPYMSINEVDDAYNGMGAEWMNKEVREILDKWFHVFRDAVIIHDCDYDRGFTEEDRLESDKRIKWNMYRCIWHEIPWYRIGTVILLFSCVRIIYRVLQLKGAKAFWKNKIK